MPRNHPKHANKFYLLSEESEYLAYKPDVNWIALSRAMKMSDTALLRRRAGRTPFTVQEFERLCLLIDVTASDVFNQRNVISYPLPYAEAS